ncbi:MAG: nickel-dependent hydrogenase large subunit [Euryarchaeota archaeon]|nr:nickel-dependent hydrogenase large subunit [Euryarchaeota archaeon]
MAAKTITLDPMTRLEGALQITVTVEDGRVTDAWSVAPMFRGIENILLGRDPRDAPVITSRVCGVCHTVHRQASTRAIENAFGLTDQIPEGAKMLRNLECGIEYIYDHALHTIALAGPDYSYNLLKQDGVDMSGWPNSYIETVKGFNFLTGKIYKEAVAQQRKLHQCLALLGGRGVFNHSWVPGGVPQAITVKLAAQLLTRVLSVQAWVDQTLVPAVVTLYKIMTEELGAHTFGQGLNDFLSYGFFDDIENPGGLLMPGGVYSGGADHGYSEANVGETIAHSWYSPDMGNQDEPVYIGDEPTPKPDVSAIDMDNPVPQDPDGKYSWAKSTRYKLNGEWLPFEVGPLARLVINRKTIGNPLDLRIDENGNPSDTAANTLNRVIARIQETLLLLGSPSLGIEGWVPQWIMELEPKAPTALPHSPNIMKDGELRGVGNWEAPRGALGHWVTIKDRKIALYNIIAATSWNASPRDHLGQRGPFEAALIDVPVPDDSNGNPILTNIGRTIRSFDPCLACTVHVFSKDNRKNYRLKVK